MQDLECYVVPAASVVGQVDRTHAAAPELALDLELTWQ
jgi:hypothetical protein